MPEYKHDVFLSHKSSNKPSALQLAGILKARGLRVWIDVEELPPGSPWRERLEQAIHDSRSIAVIVGADGIGAWQGEEVDVALRLAVQDHRPIIGVLIPGAPAMEDAQLPKTVTNRTIVDLRGGMEGPALERLIWGITGRKPESEGDTESGDADGRQWTGTRNAFLDPRLLRLYTAGGSSFLDDYFRLLRHFQHRTPIHGTLTELLSAIEKLPHEQGALASVSGFAATGKSCLLNCIYFRQLERFQSKQTRLAPVLVNLRNYLNESREDAKGGDTAAARKLADQAMALCEDAKQGADGLILIVDGCEEYYRHPWQGVIDVEFRKFVEKISVNTRVIKVVGVGQSDHAYPADRHSHVLDWAEREDLVQRNIDFGHT
jgi:hypothetical protein